VSRSTGSIPRTWFSDAILVTPPIAVGVERDPSAPNLIPRNPDAHRAQSRDPAGTGQPRWASGSVTDEVDLDSTAPANARAARPPRSDGRWPR
jgi:hypothetical protein